MYNPKSKLNLVSKGVYKNKTLRYIVPTLKSYGKEFVEKLSKLSYRGFTIGDLNYSDSLSDYIFCIVSINNYKAFNELLDYLENKDYYVTDYIYSLTNKLHCIVLKNPRPEVIDNFLAGKYSKMYSEEEINRFFLKTVTIKGVEHYTEVYAILTKRPEYQNKFIENIYKDFGTQLDLVSEDMELDYPPIQSEEILNLEEDSLLDLILTQKNILYGVSS